MKVFGCNIALFYTSTEEQIIHALAYFKAGYKCKKSLDVVASELADLHYGKISRLFRRAKRQKLPLKQFLKAYADRKIDIYMKEFITAILSDQKQFLRLATHLHLTIQNSQKPNYEDLTKRVDALGNWFLMLPLLTIAILIMDLINKTFAEIPPEAGLGLPSPLFSDFFKITVLVIGALTVCVIMVVPRVKIK